MRELEFCSNCGTALKESGADLWCPKCGKVVKASQKVDVKPRVKDKPDSIYVVDAAENSAPRVSRTCPECRNGEAYQWVSSISGEHAGVRRERTIAHFRCTRCGHSWNESR